MNGNWIRILPHCFVRKGDIPLVLEVRRLYDTEYTLSVFGRELCRGSLSSKSRYPDWLPENIRVELDEIAKELV